MTRSGRPYGLDDSGGGNARLAAAICDDIFREAEHLLGIRDQAAENGQAFLARP